MPQGAWGQGERASNSCGQSLDIFQASWPEPETGSILVTGRIVSPICVILSTDDLPASSCLQSPLQTCKPCLTMLFNIRRRLWQSHTFTNLWMSVISTLIEMLVHKVLRRLCAWWSLGYLLHQTPVSGGFANKPPKFNVETTRPNTNFLLQMMIVIHRLHVCSTPPSLNYTFIQRPLASLDILPLVTILPHWTQRWLGWWYRADIYWSIPLIMTPASLTHVRRSHEAFWSAAPGPATSVTRARHQIAAPSSPHHPIINLFIKCVGTGHSTSYSIMDGTFATSWKWF